MHVHASVHAFAALAPHLWQCASVPGACAETCCVGHVHAFIERGERVLRGCAAGGVTMRPVRKELQEGDKVGAGGRGGRMALVWVRHCIVA